MRDWIERVEVDTGARPSTNTDPSETVNLGWQRRDPGFLPSPSRLPSWSTESAPKRDTDRGQGEGLYCPHSIGREGSAAHSSIDPS
jgi:hypothetical protein